MTAIRHVGVVVADLEGMIDFYSRVFDFRLVAQAQESGRYIENLVELPEVRLEWAKLADSNGMLLELLRYYSHPDNACTPPVQRHGCSHIALTVTSIKDTVAKLRAAGGRTGKILRNPENTVWVVYARDCEGTLLELVQEI